MDEHDPSLGPGDLGRRVSYRRGELGLSREEVAQRAGMSVNYLTFLEGAGGEPGIGAVAALAKALETTVDELLGTTVALAPGGGAAAPHPALTEMGEEECWGLLRPGGIGRVAISVAGGVPQVLPVNFVIAERECLLRTAVDSSIARAAHSGSPVALEADHIDDALREGWSVVAAGTARVSTRAPAEVPSISSWAGGNRPLLISIIIETLTGRRITAT